jgi:hypothetical protein
LFSNADSSICFRVNGNLTDLITASLNTHFLISVTFFPIIVSGIFTSLSKQVYSIIATPQPATSASAILKQDSCVAASDTDVTNQALINQNAINFFKFLFIIVGVI